MWHCDQQLRSNRIVRSLRGAPDVYRWRRCQQVWLHASEPVQRRQMWNGAVGRVRGSGRLQVLRDEYVRRRCCRRHVRLYAQEVRHWAVRHDSGRVWRNDQLWRLLRA